MGAKEQKFRISCAKSSTFTNDNLTFLSIFIGIFVGKQGKAMKEFKETFQ